MCTYSSFPLNTFFWTGDLQANFISLFYLQLQLGIFFWLWPYLRRLPFLACDSYKLLPPCKQGSTAASGTVSNLVQAKQVKHLMHSGVWFACFSTQNILTAAMTIHSVIHPLHYEQWFVAGCKLSRSRLFWITAQSIPKASVRERRQALDLQPDRTKHSTASCLRYRQRKWC